MEKPYNRIVLIGNGFDLAAGLKTSYVQFITSFAKKAVKTSLENREFQSEILNIKMKNFNPANSIDKYFEQVDKRETAQDTLDYIKNIAEIQYKNDLVREIIKNHHEKRWVDLEQYYFERLKTHFHKYSIDRDKTTELKKIIDLNECMDGLTIELNKYMKEIQTTSNLTYSSSPLSQVIDTCEAPLKRRIASLVPRHDRENVPENIVYVNFNYTDTVKKLTDNSFQKLNKLHIHIHGSINNNENPIIFGYGDDTAEEYDKLEISGENELLRKIKSFQYPRSHNYHNLLNILSSEEFDVFIMGHSCGLSDKTLLRTIFEHENCLCIQNFHYLGETEDFYKRMEISRHFSDKKLMRERILPFDPLSTIPQCNN